MLCLHRADNYASVLDLKTKDEKKIAAGSWYIPTDEIEFVDDNTILTYGDYVDEVKDGVTYSQQQICRVDLCTGEVTGHLYRYRRHQYGMGKHSGRTTGSQKYCNRRYTFSVKGTDAETHFLKKAGDYVLFGNKEENAPYFLVSLSARKFMRIDVPKELSGQMKYIWPAQKRSCCWSAIRKDTQRSTV